jgi:hypothetical protein
MGDPARFLLTNAGAAGLIALLAWAASRVVRRQAVLHGLWLLALVKLVTPPIAPLPLLPAWTGLPFLSERPTPTVVEMVAPGTADTLAQPMPATAPSSIPRRQPAVGMPRAATATDFRTTALPRVPPGIRIGWRGPAWGLLALGAVAIAALAAWRFTRFGRLLACARPAPPSVADRSSALGGRIGLRRAPSVLLVPARIPPMLWPCARGPQLLLPTGLLPQLNTEELDALLAHELAHVRRRDHWVRLVEIAATALFWWYPVAWWARRALRRAEERCCDEWVLRLLPHSAEAYANGLLKSLTFVSGSPLPSVASGLGAADDLEARLKEILMTRPAPRLAAPLRLALAVAAALGLAVFPMQAQSSTAKDDPSTPTTAAASAPAATPAPVTKPAPAERPAPAARSLPAPAAALPALALPAPPTPQPVPAPVAAPFPDPERRALEDERRAIEEQRRKLHQQELELAKKQVELEAQVREAELRALAERLRADGKADDALRVEKQAQLNVRRAELQKRQLELEAERAALEARLEAEMRSHQDQLEAIEESRHQGAAEDARRELKRAEEERQFAEQELRRRQHAMQAEIAAAEKRTQALAAEDRVKAAHEMTEALARSLAGQIDSLKRALASAPGQKAEIGREIRRLEAALDALRSETTSTAPKTPRPQP